MLKKNFPSGFGQLVLRPASEAAADLRRHRPRRQEQKEERQVRESKVVLRSDVAKMSLGSNEAQSDVNKSLDGVTYPG